MRLDRDVVRMVFLCVGGVALQKMVINVKYLI